MGRRRELALLHAAFDDAMAGRDTLVLISGEGGIGKTRLVEELRDRTSATGAAFVWGRCFEHGDMTAYWPWVQIARACLRLLGRSPSDGVQLSDVVLQDSAAVDDRAGRLRLFDAVASLLRDLAESRPVVVVLDDVHAADVDSIALLRFVQQQLHGARVLLLATYRDYDLHLRPEVAQALDSVATAGVDITLGALSESDVAMIVAALAPGADVGVIAPTVHDLAEGNPFFVLELTGAVAAGRSVHDLRSLPPGVRGHLAARLAPLSQATRRLLAVAALVGREVDIGLLTDVADERPDKVLPALAEAHDAGLLIADGASDTYRFSHSLVRAALVDEVPLQRRGDLHHTVAAALARRGGALPELAYHYGHSSHPEDRVLAFTSARAAGEEAQSALAYEQAAAQYASAATAAASAGVDPRQRYDVLVALGEARARTGRREGARDALMLAAGVARQLGDPLLEAGALVRVPESIAGIGPRGGAADHALVAALRAALRRLPADDPSLRARVRARLVMAAFWVTTDAERRQGAVAAIAEAEVSGDPLAVAAALLAQRVALTGPRHTRDRIPLATRAIAAAEAANDQSLALRARVGRLTDRLELGDLTGFDADVAVVDRVARASHDPYARWHVTSWRGMRAVLEGRYDDAEVAIAEAYAQATRIGDPDAIECAAIQHLTRCWLIGDVRQADEVLALAGHRDPPLPAWECALVNYAALNGRLEDARQRLTRLAADDFAAVPRDGDFLVAAQSLAGACAHLGDTVHATQLYEVLVPFADRFVVVGPGVVWNGAVEHSLGVLAVTGGRLDAAIAHFESALAACDHLGARGFAAQGQLELAATLLQRARAGDAERARGLLVDASATLQALGMEPDAQRAQALLDRVQRPAGMPQHSDASQTAGPHASLTLEGDHWRFVFGGRELHVKDSVGVRYIAALVAAAGRELLALDLARMRDGDAAPRPSVVASSRGDVGPLLDDKAKAAYRARIAELRATIEAAGEAGDDERHAAARAELEDLQDQLASSLGLGGRDRRHGSAAERARLSVTKAIRYSTRRIADRHPALGRHLESSIHTGTYCRYDPSPSDAVTWRLGR